MTTMTPTTTDRDPVPPTPGGFPMRPYWWQARPGAYIDPETIRLERNTSTKGRLRRQAAFYRDDPRAPCLPESWELGCDARADRAA